MGSEISDAFPQLHLFRKVWRDFSSLTLIKVYRSNVPMAADINQKAKVFVQTIMYNKKLNKNYASKECAYMKIFKQSLMNLTSIRSRFAFWRTIKCTHLQYSVWLNVPKVTLLSWNINSYEWKVTRDCNIAPKWFSGNQLSHLWEAAVKLIFSRKDQQNISKRFHQWYVTRSQEKKVDNNTSATSNTSGKYKRWFLYIKLPSYPEENIRW